MPEKSGGENYPSVEFISYLLMLFLFFSSVALCELKLFPSGNIREYVRIFFNFAQHCDPGNTKTLNYYLLYFILYLLEWLFLKSYTKDDIHTYMPSKCRDAEGNNNST